jgi:hypothetical protein
MYFYYLLYEILERRNLPAPSFPNEKVECMAGINIIPMLENPVTVKTSVPLQRMPYYTKRPVSVYITS